MSRTKEELIKELEATKAERDAAAAHAKASDAKVAELKAEIDKADTRQKMFSEMYESALMLKATQDAFIEAGFDEEQAFEIMLNMMISCTQRPAPSVSSLLEAVIK
jgi:hypothetical protein